MISTIDEFIMSRRPEKRFPWVKRESDPKTLKNRELSWEFSVNSTFAYPCNGPPRNNFSQFKIKNYVFTNKSLGYFKQQQKIVIIKKSFQKKQLLNQFKQQQFFQPAFIFTSPSEQLPKFNNL